jgi:hypothetical protein
VIVLQCNILLRGGRSCSYRSSSSGGSAYARSIVSPVVSLVVGVVPMVVILDTSRVMIQTAVSKVLHRCWC